MELIEEEFFDTIQDEGGTSTELMELSLNAFLGQPSPTTTKLRGLVGKRDVILMFDTHKFITLMVAEQFQLRIIISNII